MPTAKIRFPGGRYHATPWGHHVNEGMIEWPPSPWRLLRALIATGYATHHWETVPKDGCRLIEALASGLPTFLVPKVSAAHSRHYMPVGKLSNGLEKTTLVFDTWANVGDGELIVRWDCELDPRLHDLFTSLVESLGYIGRSESWIEATVIDDSISWEELKKISPTDSELAFPHQANDCPGSGWEQFHLMAATKPESYSSWREEETTTLLEKLPLPEGKKPPKSLLNNRAKVMEPYPVDLIDCLQKDTAWWKKQHKWSQPPGSRRSLYWRRVDSLVVSQPAKPKHFGTHSVTTMLLAISTPSRNQSALPPVTRTLPQAELFHRAIVGRVAKGKRVDCPELIGKDNNGRPLQTNHKHAHILPIDLDGDGHLDHILVYAPMGLGGEAQHAIRTLKRTWTKGSIGDLQIALVGRGDLNSLRNLPDLFQPKIAEILGPVGGSQTWVSSTPFVAPRYIKQNGKNTLHGQINSELKSRGLPGADTIEILAADGDASRLRHFKRVRRHGGSPPPNDTGYSVRIELEHPIEGPICLGYGAHFGLGGFAAASGIK